MDTVTNSKGETLYVDQRKGKRGQKSPFYIVYADKSGDTRWGFYCSNCESLDNAVDAMGRVKCNVCSNRTKAEEWDAAHE
ncbi:DUF5816 domain-containing protein [Halovenus rubra]|uniref:DUF5816 domain-containing protein n=2 Tax=Halovenus rubra TaxID=869890 RepID=A0ACC7DYX1_9EURY|nr:DUF5816 domain-containing protein [Halovenus rubra]